MDSERVLDEIASVVGSEREAQADEYPSEVHAVSRIEFGRVDDSYKPSLYLREA